MFASMLKKIWANNRQGARCARSFEPRLEALDDRIVPTTWNLNSDGVLTLTSTDAAETIVLRHHGNGEIKVEAPDLDRTFSEVDRVVLDTKGGNDVVRYVLDGNLTSSMSFSIDLGTGNDRFTGTLNQDITGQELTLSFWVNGESGSDLISLYGTETAPAIPNDSLTDGLAINEGGLRIAANSRLDFSAQGADGNDRIFFYYNGELDGDISLWIDGFAGDDTIWTAMTLRDGSSGDIVDSVIYGGYDSDDVNVGIYDHSPNFHNSTELNAFGCSDLNGWWEAFDHDRGHFTANVDIIYGFEEIY